jgi:16S rRNA (guanine527-N7)-methyltransferase
MSDLRDAIAERAAASGIELALPAVEALAIHAQRVLDENDRLHLTAIRKREEFIERHIGESFEGAAMLAPDVQGGMLDLGSGNGYPALPLAAARPGLVPLLTEASKGKAEFLRAVITECGFKGALLAGQIQRPSDLEEGQTDFRLVTVRALGGWERILPRFSSCLHDGGELLLWAGEDVERVARRSAWKKLQLIDKKALPGRDRSWVWRFTCL